MTRPGSARPVPLGLLQPGAVKAQLLTRRLPQEDHIEELTGRGSVRALAPFVPGQQVAARLMQAHVVGNLLEDRASRGQQFRPDSCVYRPPEGEVVRLALKKPRAAVVIAKSVMVNSLMWTSSKMS